MSLNLKQLARVDLNLLVTLHVLLEQQSVSLAAEKLHLTQPALSKALGRLRELLGDPLFSRASRGLVPTPHALALQEPLRRLLESASVLLGPEEFDAGTWKGEFTLAMNGMMQLILLPKLVELLSRNAPGVVLKVRSQFRNQLQGLEEGELDFVLNLEFSGLSPAFHSEVVYTDTPAIYARAGHPLHKKQFQRQEMQRYPRIAVRMPDLEKFLLFQSHDLQAATDDAWPAACETDNMNVALGILVRTDYLLPGSGMLASLASRELNFKPLQAPVAAASFKVTNCLVSHQRVSNSAPHHWLRATVREVLQELI